METYRAFFAVFPSPTAEAALNDYVRSLKTALREVSWVKPGNLHLTLRFFGELPEGRVDAAATAARDACASSAPFRLAFADPGAFPSMQSPKVVWLGVEEGRGGLVGLAAALELALVRGGLGRADKPFAPHLTLGRVRDHLPSAALPALFARHPSPRPSFDVTRLALIRSQLDPKGSIYTELAAAPLGATA